MQEENSLWKLRQCPPLDWTIKAMRGRIGSVVGHLRQDLWLGLGSCWNTGAAPVHGWPTCPWLFPALLPVSIPCSWVVALG